MLPSLFVVTVCGGRDTTVSSRSSSSAQSGRLWQGVSQELDVVMSACVMWWIRAVAGCSAAKTYFATLDMVDISVYARDNGPLRMYGYVVGEMVVVYYIV